MFDSLSLALHRRKGHMILLLLLLGVVTILRIEVYVLIIMITVLLKSLEVVIGDDTHVVLIRFPRSSKVKTLLVKHQLLTSSHLDLEAMSV